MSGGSPNSPQLSKMSLVVFRAPNPVPSVMAFQYNPETVSRDVQANVVEGAAGGAVRFGGAATETLKMECVFDATDGLEDGYDLAREAGVRPQIAALEILLAPSIAIEIANTALLALGTLEILPSEAPFIVLIMGERIRPVRLSGLSVTEEFFDENLNPVRAKVSLDFNIVPYSELDPTHPGYALAVNHQRRRESLAVKGRQASLSSVIAQQLRGF